MPRRSLAMGGTPGSQVLTGAGVPADASGVNGDFYFRTNGAVYTKTAGTWGAAIATLVPVAAAVFDQSANATTATAVPAAVNVGSLVLLSDVITAVGTLQSGINANRQLLNRLINIVRGAG